MKIVLTLVLFVVSFGVFATKVSAQKRPISFDEYNKLVYPNGYQDESRVRRVLSLTERYTDGVISERTSETYEWLGWNHFRQLLTIEKGDVTETSETIRVGSFRFKRANNGAWTKEDLSNEIISIGCGYGPFRSNQYSVEFVNLNGTTVGLYENISVWNEKDRLQYSESRRWSDNDGKVHRSEFESGTLSPRLADYRQSKTYEYDLKGLKIEAPVK